VWASEVAEGESWTNPYTNKAKMIAVQSGDAHVGSWTVQSRNVAEDFKTHFGMDIKELADLPSWLMATMGCERRRPGLAKLTSAKTKRTVLEKPIARIPLIL
jgi:hypothetical protein